MSTRSISIFKDPHIAEHLSVLLVTHVIIFALIILFVCVNNITYTA
jgi:hypothetical protein